MSGSKLKHTKSTEKKSEPDLPRCRHNGCKNVATHWYQLMTLTTFRCDDHGQHTIMSTIYDSGEFCYDKEKSKSLGMTPIDLSIPGMIGSVHMKFCKACTMAEEDHTFQEQTQCRRKLAQRNGELNG